MNELGYADVSATASRRCRTVHLQQPTPRFAIPFIEGTVLLLQLQSLVACRLIREQPRMQYRELMPLERQPTTEVGRMEDISETASYMRQLQNAEAGRRRLTRRLIDAAATCWVLLAEDIRVTTSEYSVWRTRHMSAAATGWQSAAAGETTTFVAASTNCAADADSGAARVHIGRDGTRWKRRIPL